MSLNFLTVRKVLGSDTPAARINPICRDRKMAILAPRFRHTAHDLCSEGDVPSGVFDCAKDFRGGDDLSKLATDSVLRVEVSAVEAGDLHQFALSQGRLVSDDPRGGVG